MEIQPLYTFVNEILVDGKYRADEPLRKVAVAAVVANPFAGRYVDDLTPLIDASTELGRRMAEVAFSAMKGLPIESYGKGAEVGLAGEQEHAVSTGLLIDVYHSW